MKKKLRIILLILCILIIIASGIWLYMDYRERQENQDVYEEIKEEVVEQIEEVPEEPDYIPIDFAKLKETNEDIYAWIEIEDTNIAYPIVQHPTDDSYYLDYTIDGKKGYPGSIYTESINAKDFSDFNTVVYGHDMKNGTMFKHLHKFEKADFFDSHDTVTIYTETEHKEYKVFAAIVFDDRHLMYSFNYDTAEGRKAFLETIFESHNMKNLYRDDVIVDENSHILTLSTCIGGKPNNRYLVLAVEVDE